MSKADNILQLLARNSITSLLRYVITVPLMLLVVPYILHQIGEELFGIWALFGVVTAYAYLSDLGIGTALTRFVAHYWVTDDRQAINRSVNTVLLIYSITGGLVTAIIILSSRFIATSILNVPITLVNEAAFTIAGAGISVIISLLSGTFGSVIQGAQRMDLSNASLVAYSLLDALGVLIAVSLGYGLYGLIVSRILVNLFIGLLNGWIVHRILPTLKYRFSYCNWDSTREIVGYSLNIFVSKIAVVAQEPLNKVILLQLVSLNAVTYFDLAGRIAKQTRGIFSAMLIPLLPASSGIQTSGGLEATHWLFYRSTRYVVFLVFPIFGGLIILANPIINAWIGPEYEVVALSLQILLIAHFFSLLAAPAYVIMEGIGFAKISAISTVLTAVLNIILGISLGLQFGYWGILAGYGIAMAIASIVTLVFFHKLLAVPVKQFLYAIPLRAILINCCLMAVLGSIEPYLDLHNLFMLIIVSVMYFLLCVLGIFISGSLYKDEVSFIRRYLPSFV